MPSSPINIAGRQPSLMQVLSTVPDPRCARGMRHRLEVILAVAVGAVLSGARSLLAIGQWAAGLDAEARTRLGLPASARLPEETTIRRVLSSVDGAALDAAVGAWMWSRTAATVAGRLTCSHVEPSTNSPGGSTKASSSPTSISRVSSGCSSAGSMCG